MSYIYSTKEFPAFTNLVLLFSRIFAGVSMIFLHGLPKLEKLQAGGEIKFFSFIGLGSDTTLILAIFMELVLSFLIIIGLFTRATALMMMLLMAVAALVVHAGDPFSVRETSLLYLTIYALILAAGPGRFSIDKMITKRRESKW